MDEIIPGLWIGGLKAALSVDYLAEAGITHIITCMKQRLPPPPALPDGRRIPAENIRQVRVDDLDQSPILAHFASCNDFIAQALQEEWVESPDETDDSGDMEAMLVQGKQQRGGKWGNWQTTGEGTVLVHCQAGCSRSVAIGAAYLMKIRSITAAQAVRLIQARRKDAQPNPGFMAQLELYEQVGYDIDMRHQSVRRFLMSKTDILNGDSFDDMLLSYYPSPYPSPALSNGLKGLSVMSSSDGDLADQEESPSSSIAQQDEVRVTSNTSGHLPGGVTSLKGHEGGQNRGSLPKPTFNGPKLRCKSCRRELAALDHVIEHEPGKGQMAFDHRRRETGQAKYASEKQATNATSAPEVAEEATAAEEEEQKTEPVSAPNIQSGASINARLPPHLAALRGIKPTADKAQRSILHSPDCSAYFIEPMAWMSALAEGEVSGKLSCPAKRCGAKLGSWDWAGMQCGCGAWVTPAFSLHRSKVDQV